MFSTWPQQDTHQRLLRAMRFVAVALLKLLWSIAPLSYAHAYNESTESQWSYQIGADAWQISASTRVNSNPGRVEERSWLYLPDYDTNWRYKDTSAYGWVVGNKALTQKLNVSLKAQANQQLGLRIDEAQVEHHISPYLGFRFGVVDYKTSWCRTYETDSVWMRDIEPLCNFQTYRDITGGAPGIQLFIKKNWDQYQFQAQAGIYRPRMWNYAPKEFGDLAPVPSLDYEYSVQSNKKTGFNINMLDMTRGIEARLSYIHGTQQAYAPASDYQGTTRQASNAMYAAISFPITEKLSARFTKFEQTQDSTCRSNVAPFSHCNLNAYYKKAFTSAETSYAFNTHQTIGFGISRISYDFEQHDYDTALLVYLSAPHRNTEVEQKNFAWRANWSAGFFTVVQYIWAKQTTTYKSAFPSDGHALGLRMGYQF